MAYPQPPPGYPMAQAPPPVVWNPNPDIEGVGQLKIGALLGVIVQALFWIGFGVFYLIFNALSTSTNIYGTATALPSWITVNTVYLAVAMLAGGLIIGVVSFVFFYLGFRAIKRGSPDFGGPTALMIIGLVGFLLMALGIVLIVGAVVSAINSAAAGTISSGSASIDLSAIFGGLAAVGLGAILALIGVIGLVLGNWRAGSRYGETSVKIGAILSILPYISIVGYILLLVGYSKVGTKLRTPGWVPSGMMMATPVVVGYVVPGATPPGMPGWQPPPPPPGR